MEQILASKASRVQNFTKNRSKKFRGPPPRTPLGLSPQTPLDTIIPVSLYVVVATQGSAWRLTCVGDGQRGGFIWMLAAALFSVNLKKQ